MPETVNILGFTFQIKYLGKYEMGRTSDGNELIGECDFFSQEIRICKDYPLDIQRNVLMHEMLHAYAHAIGNERLAKDEDSIDQMTAIVYQLIKLNKEISKWLNGDG